MDADNWEVKNAVIEGATITTSERGFLDAWLTLDYGGSGQGFGGYALNLLSVAGHFIYRVMEVAEVTRWEDLKGKTLRVKANHSGIHAIGHIVKDDWFCPSEDFKALKKPQEAA